jgi:hypothetical protein
MKTMRSVGRGGAAAFIGGVLLFAACSHVASEPPPSMMGASPDAKNYCAIVGACQLFPALGFGECINEIVRDQITLAPFGGDLGAQDRYNCVKAAGTDCAKAKLCVGRVQAADPRCTDPDAGAPFGNQAPSFCDGNRITVCNAMGPGSQSFACSDDFATQHFGGPYCVKNAPGSALCGFATCDSDAGLAASCAGNTLTYCTNAVEQRTLCSALGGTCDVSSGQCMGTCSGTSYECSGTLLLRDCSGGTKLPLYDCAARSGWTCRPPMDATTFGCVPPSTECVWGVYQASCMGTSVKYCDDGKIATYDCTQSGAKTCTTTPGGVTCSL